MSRRQKKEGDLLEDLKGSIADEGNGGPLGPALTADFTQAVGLQELVGKSKASGGAGRSGSGFGTAAPAAPAAPAPPVAPPVDYDNLIFKLFQTVDAAASAVAGIEREADSDLKTFATSVTPFVVRHAGDAESETAIRLIALAGIVAFIATKVIRWSQKPRPKKQRPDVATAADDFVEEPAV